MLEQGNGVPAFFLGETHYQSQHYFKNNELTSKHADTHKSLHFY